MGANVPRAPSRIRRRISDACLRRRRLREWIPPSPSPTDLALLQRTNERGIHWGVLAYGRAEPPPDRQGW